MCVKVSNKICPICEQEIIGYPATSRRDNKTEICSPCGTNEAMMDFALHLEKKERVSK